MTISHTATVDTPLPKSDVSNQAPAAQERVIYADVVRAFAIFLVVQTHSASELLSNFDAHSAWWTGAAISSVGRICTPMFVMLSGLFLLSVKNESAGQFWKKRMPRVVLPLVVWSVIYVFWSSYLYHSPVTIKSFTNLVTAPAFYHLGFLYLLLAVYIATPIFRLFVKEAKKGDYSYAIGAWLAFYSIIPTIQRFARVSIMFQPIATTGFAGFYLLGYSLRNVKVGKSAMALLGSVCALSTVGMMVTTYLLTKQKHGVLNETFLETFSPFVVAFSIACYLILKSLPYERLFENRQWLSIAIESLSKHSFTIYLAHAIFLTLVYRTGIFSHIHTHSVLGAVARVELVTLTTLAVTWLFAILARRLKVPTWIVP